MSNDLLEDAPFLSVAAPKEAIIDYSQRLPAADKANLESLCQQLEYKAKVVILPQDFSPGKGSSYDHFCRALAHQWKVKDNRFLLVIDQKGHQARGLSGDGLEARGISSDYISGVILRGDFISHMKSGELSQAIQSALNRVNSKLAEKREMTNAPTLTPALSPTPRPVTGTAVAAPTPTNITMIPISGLMIFLALIIAIGVAVWSKNKKNRDGMSKSLYGSVQAKLAGLYEKADEIGLAAEYLDHYKEPQLARDVATIFNHFAVINTAQSEVERLDAKGKISDAYESLRKMDKMADILKEESDEILPRINTATGVVQTAISPHAVSSDFEQSALARVRSDDDEKASLKKEEEARELARQEEERRRKWELACQQRRSEYGLSLNEPFYRPSWAYQPVYYQSSVYNDPFVGVQNYMTTMNQMEMAQQQQLYYSEMDRNRSSASNNSWSNMGSNNQSSSDDSSWGSSSSDSSSSSWGDSSSSSDSSSDSGGGFSGGDGGTNW